MYFRPARVRMQLRSTELPALDGRDRGRSPSGAFARGGWLGAGALGSVRRSPAREQLQPLLRRRGGLRGVGEHRQARIGGQLHRLVRELEIADDRMVQVLGTRPVEAHVVVRPARAELLALRRELADEIGGVAVVGGRPAWLRRTATESSAAWSQSTKKVVARGSRKVKRAEFTGARGFANISEYRARPSWFAPRMSMRPLA